MVKIEQLIKEGKLMKLRELEAERYQNFLLSSSQDNLSHSKATMQSFPRWSIISGYYAMHDRAKLFLAKLLLVKVEREVHATTIKALRDALSRKDLVLLEKGYKEFLSLASDLEEAKKERVRTQYYTGTGFMKGEYQKKARTFHEKIVLPFLLRMKKIGESDD